MKKPLAILLSLTALARADFAFQDGDKVAFLGDSITAARGYTKIVEHYTLMRFPERKIRFVNAGEGGDTATKVQARLQRDVFDQGATVVTVAYGINDIGWGTKADAEHKKLYMDGIRSIIERCRANKVRPIICSAAITAGNPDDAEKETLQTMCDEGLAMAKSMGVETIDLQRGMRAIQRKVVETNKDEKDPEKQTRLHMKDGVHLEELGQLAMAYAMLKGLGAPEDVSSAEIDFKGGPAVAEACAISDVSRTSGGMEFTRLDEGLPLNLGPLTQLQSRWIPVPAGINRYLLSVKNLPEGDYSVSADGRGLGTCSAAQLAAGINMASMTADGWVPGGPWDVQSCVVKELVDGRDKLWMGGVLAKRYRTGTEEGAKTDASFAKMDEEIVQAQRANAKPRPYRFKIEKVK